jgi:hypothetical protein
MGNELREFASSHPAKDAIVAGRYRYQVSVCDTVDRHKMEHKIAVELGWLVVTE